MSVTATDKETQLRRDKEQINLLAIFHFIVAGLSMIGIAFLVFHFLAMNSVLGNEKFMEMAEMDEQGEMPFSPVEFFSIFKWFYLLMGMVFIGACIVNVLSAVFMRQRRHRTFSMVVAGLNCLSVPVGTLLGVFTLLVLLRPTVEESYKASDTAD